MRRAVAVGVAAGFAVMVTAGLAACTSDDDAARPTTATTRPPGFPATALQNGYDLDPIGDGLAGVSLWWFEDHPGTKDRTVVLTDEQFVPQPVPTEVGDAAVGIRGGAFCLIRPTIRVETVGGRAIVDIDEFTDDELAEYPDIQCPAAEFLVVIVFALADGISELTVEGVDVPIEA